MKGIIQNKKTKKWIANLWYVNKNDILSSSHHLGTFNTELEAENHLVKISKELLEKGISFGKRVDNYVNPKELYIEIVISKAQGSLTNKAVKMLMMMIKKIGLKFRYNYEVDRQDTTQYTTLNLLNNWRNFEEDKYDNAFAYYTEIIKRGYAMQWKNLVKHQGHISIEGTYESGATLNI